MRTVRTARRSRWHPASWPAWVGLAVLRLLAMLPYAWLLRLGPLLGAAAWPLAGRRRRIAARNIAWCLPELSPADQADLLSRQGRDMGMMLLEFALAWFGSERAIDRVPVQFEGLEQLQQLIASGRGVILVGGHFSHLELAGRLLARRVPLAGMYREHGDPVFEQAVLRARLVYAAAMFRRDELRPTIRYLKAGGVLWYAPDQDYRRGEHVFVPWFGVPAATLTATHQLARLSGAAVMGFFHERLPAGGYRIRFAAPLADFPSADVADDTARVNRLLEQMVRAAPSQYLWVHARFKRRPDGSASPY